MSEKAVRKAELVVPLMPPDAELPEALRDLPKESYRRFCWFYVFGGANGAEAARQAGYSDSGEACKVRAYGLLQRDDIQEAIRALTSKHLHGLAPLAVLRLAELLNNPRHPQHSRAIEMTLSRSGHGERSTVDVNVKVAIDHTAEAIEQLRMLKSIGVPREELERTFGFSGLGRYEALLEQREARQPPVIEHIPAPEREPIDG